MILSAETAPQSIDVIRGRFIYFIDNTGCLRKANIAPVFSPNLFSLVVGVNAATSYSGESEVFVANTSQPQQAICNVVAGDVENSFIYYVSEEANRETISSSTENPFLSATGLNQQQEIEMIVDLIFREAEDQDFADGMESDFSRRLLAAVRKHGNQAMQEISYLVIYGKTSIEVASEALRWLGRIDDFQTYGWRLWLLEKSLSSDSPLIRYSAALGLASMNDPNAIPVINKAISQEACDELRADLRVVLDDLEASHRCHSSY